MTVELLFDAKATLGEGPVWEARTQTIYWLDILEKRVYVGSDVLIQLDDLIGCMAPRKSGGLIITTSRGDEGRFDLSGLEVDSAQLSLIVSLSGEPSTNRFNDGKCDPRGRFLVGTMNLNEKDPTGSLYSYDGRTFTRIINNTVISNGMTWSPDYKTFYYIDTPTRQVKAYDYDIETGEIANPRVSVNMPESLGWPDGMTSDMQGNLWIAMWGGAQITKWNPSTGKLLEKIPVPARNVSSCTFGGKNMNELYITSARKELNEAMLKKYPFTGGLFRLETKVEGMPTFEFAG